MTPEELYGIKRAVASRYSIIQVGLCLFHENTTIANNAVTTPAAAGLQKSSFDEVAANETSVRLLPQHRRGCSARPFNFFVFPFDVSSLILDADKGVVDGAAGNTSMASLRRDLTLSPDAVGFLRRHGMDFQRWIYRGVSIVDAAGEAVVRTHLKQRDETRRATAKKTAVDARAQLSPEERTWLDAAVARVKEFAAPPPHLAALALCADDALPSVKSAPAVAALQLTVEAEEIEGVKIVARGRFPHRDAVIVRRSSFERSAQNEKELVDLIGFRRVFRAMIESKKPCIGHNCFVDWLFVMNALDGPLPATLGGFKQRMRPMFPTLYDTKLIAQHPAISQALQQEGSSTSRFPNTHLGTLYETYATEAVTKGPDSLAGRTVPWLPLGHHSYAAAALGKRSSAAHEAGFDALMTGTVFRCLQAEFGRGPTDECEGQLALFRSLYAIDMKHDDKDVFLPRSGKYVELCHPWGEAFNLVEGFVRTHCNGVVKKPTAPVAEANTGTKPTLQETRLAPQLMYSTTTPGVAVVSIEGTDDATTMEWCRRAMQQSKASEVKATIFQPQRELTQLQNTKKPKALLLQRLRTEASSMDLSRTPLLRRILSRILKKR